jgi:hypothetical protein
VTPSGCHAEQSRRGPGLNLYCCPIAVAQPKAEVGSQNESVNFIQPGSHDPAANLDLRITNQPVEVECFAIAALLVVSANFN